MHSLGLHSVMGGGMGENGYLVEFAVFCLGEKSRPAQVPTCTHVTSATSVHPTSGNWHWKYIRTQLNSKITQSSAVMDMRRLPYLYIIATMTAQQHA